MNWPDKLSSLDKMAFAELVRYIACDLGVRRISFSQKPMLKADYCETTSSSRVDIVLSGQKHIQYPLADGIADDLLDAGDMVCSPPGTGKYPIWDKVHEMCGLVLSPDFFRITYIRLDAPIFTAIGGIKAPYFYHLSQPPSETSIKLLSILESEAASGAEQPLLQSIMTSLLLKLRDDIANDKQAICSKSQLTWQHLKEYVHLNVFTPITREEIASHLHLNASYVTYLFRKYSKQTLVEYIRDLRLDYARKLLEESDSSVYEIAMLCGYQSSTSFIAGFRNKYGIAPGHFRNKFQNEG